MKKKFLLQKAHDSKTGVQQMQETALHYLIRSEAVG